MQDLPSTPTGSTEAPPMSISSTSTSSADTSPGPPARALATDNKRKVTMCPSVTDPVPTTYDPKNPFKAPSETCGSEVDLEVGKTLVAAPDGDLPRLVLRNRPFHQSANKVHIQHNQGIRIFSLLKFNWFHVMLRWPTSRSLLALMTAWTGAILVFAGIYVWYDNLDTTISCGLGQIDEPMTWAAAFAFSLETCTTVGYGLPHGINSYFEEGCRSLQIIIYFQMAWSMVFNAFLITFLYNRLGRVETRSNQVICSNKALVSLVDGQVRFQVRLFDADAKHPVVEAHVRMYAIMKHRPVPRPLRLLQPDDELGGMLFLSFPTVINHHVDLYSLLHPPTASMAMPPSGLLLRQCDGATANRDDVICPVCGESYGTLERWKNHVRFNQIAEAKDEWPVEGSHLSLDMDEIEQQAGLRPTDNLQELKEYFQRNVSEVICVTEGIDPLTSGTFQALQSYRLEDIIWEPHSQFAPCMKIVENSNTRIFEVDLNRYHDVVIDEEAAAAANKLGSSRSPTSSKAAPQRERRRRVKTLSRRQSDGLFDA